jgi:hypothetical protein
VGQLNGPLALSVPALQVLDAGLSPGDAYFSIFKVLSTTGERGPEPFATAQRRARALVRRQQESILADQFLQGLRRQYEPRVKVFRQAIEALARQ